MEQVDDVLDYWFGGSPDNVRTPERQAQLWWGKNEDVDREIEEQFGTLLKELVFGEHKEWLDKAEGRLAAIIVLDQFSRNMFRDTAMAFEQDSLALQLCLEGIELEQDLELFPVQRVFFYLPLEHSESMQMQNMMVSLMDKLVNLVEEPAKEIFGDFYQYAIAHRKVIERFGRYPHRNEILGRESTPEELQYLEEPGSGF